MSFTLLREVERHLSISQFYKETFVNIQWVTVCLIRLHHCMSIQYIPSSYIEIHLNLTVTELF